MCNFKDCIEVVRYLFKEGGCFIMVYWVERLMDVLIELRYGKIEFKVLMLVYSKYDKFV